MTERTEREALARDLRGRLEVLRAAGVRYAFLGRERAAAPAPPPESSAPAHEPPPAPDGGAAESAPAYAASGQTAIFDTPETSPMPSRAPAKKGFTPPPLPFDPKAEMTLDVLAAAVDGCLRCGLGAGRMNLVFGAGNPDADLVFIGEAPGADEDAQGIPFVGRSGQMLTRMIKNVIGIPREEVYIGNILKCRPPGNRDPEPGEIACCEPYLHKQLEIIRPRVIVALGRFAAQWLLATKTPIGRMRGKFGRYRGIPTLATYHPAYLLRNPSEKRNVLDDLLKVKAICNGEAEPEIEIFG